MLQIRSRLTEHTSQHSSTSPSTGTQLVHPLQRRKAIVCINTCFARFVKLIRENVQHKFTVALGVDMPVSLVIESLAQCRCVDQVSVVRHANAVWAVDVERLGFGVCTAASGRVSQMSEAHEARKVRDARAVLENPGSHTVTLALVEASTSAATDDTSGILATMLEEVEGIMHLDRCRLRLWIAMDHRNDTAHIDVIMRRVEV